jgi:pimeloyl-ACP methyl ester carboxylesterase
MNSMLGFVVPGMFCTKWHISNLTKRVDTELFSCIPVTLPCHDIETISNDVSSFGVEDYVAYLCHLIQKERQNREVVLIGHSMGGLLVQLVVEKLNSPSWLRLVIVLGSAPSSEIKQISFRNAVAFAPELLGYRSRGFLLKRGLYKWLFMNMQEAAFVNSVYKMLVPESRKALKQIALPWLQSEDVTEVDIRTSHVRYLVIAGGADRSTPVGMQRTISQRLPSGKLCVVDDVDHYGLIDGKGSDVVYAILHQWIKENLST